MSFILNFKGQSLYLAQRFFYKYIKLNGLTPNPQRSKTTVQILIPLQNLIFPHMIHHSHPIREANSSNHPFPWRNSSVPKEPILIIQIIPVFMSLVQPSDLYHPRLYFPRFFHPNHSQLQRNSSVPKEPILIIQPSHLYHPSFYPLSSFFRPRSPYSFFRPYVFCHPSSVFCLSFFF